MTFASWVERALARLGHAFAFMHSPPAWEDHAGDDAFREDQAPLRSLIDSIPDHGTARHQSPSTASAGEPLAGVWTGVSSDPGRHGQIDTYCVARFCLSYGEQVAPRHVHKPMTPDAHETPARAQIKVGDQWFTDPPEGVGPWIPSSCHAGQDGDCGWVDCPQLRDGEPVRTGRHCPLDRDED